MPDEAAKKEKKSARYREKGEKISIGPKEQGRWEERGENSRKEDKPTTGRA